MLRFNCENCGHLIEDVCGEYVDTNEDGTVITYECPYCGKIIDQVTVDDKE